MGALPKSGFNRLRTGRSFARRLFLLFVAAAMLPLAMSDWLSGVAVSRLTEDSYARDRKLLTGQVSREVFDRLMTGKTLLSAISAYDPDSLVRPGAAHGTGRQFPGLHAVFRDVAQLAPNGDVLWTSNPGADLASAWRSSADTIASANSTAERPPGRGLRVSVRIVTTTPARVLIGASIGRDPAWIAELAPDFLWSPLHNASDDSAWRVSDARGRAIARFDGEDFPKNTAGSNVFSSGEFLHSAHTLFLRAEFEAVDWRFEQWSPRPHAQWLGIPLRFWLGLVAAGTLLSITLAISWQIRRALTPLETLREGTQRLAGGAAHTRVTAEGDDEFSDLAHAFNHMAGRIEAQFTALKDLAAIDNDILAGAPIQRVADRILRRIQAQLPDARVAVSWLDASGELNTVTAHREAAGEEPHPEWRHEMLSPDARSRFIGLADDELHVHASEETRKDPWQALPDERHPGSIAVLPVRDQGRTQAVISACLPEPFPAEALQPVQELRDRLAVAFAAWSRERELAYRATHDGLTGLANRSGLHEFLDAALHSAAMDDAISTHDVAVLFIDLDHFKDINDALGHDAGDELLCLAAQRLLGRMPPESLLARPGGDEFVAVIPQCSETQASGLAALIVQQLAQPFALRGAERTLGASVGIALAPAHGIQRDTLMRRADAAMYAAKEAGRGRFMMFSEYMDIRARDRLRIQSELPSAIANGELAAYFQPRIRLSDMSITSAEALVRWNHPTLGLLLPGAFIGFAEENELIVQLGDWMLNEAVGQMVRWRKLGANIARVSVNISPRQLKEGRLLEKVKAALDRHGLSARHLELEVTESVMVGDSDGARVQLAQLRALGITVAMDDFGTGYSSMATLRSLPIDVMKIDRAFVKDLDKTDTERQGALAIVRAIVAMAKSMNVGLVAEGIETQGQAEVLRLLECDEFQGLLYGPAEPAVDFEARLLTGNVF
jgi:diguanylate cyclase (GGDEF)-like protein